MRPQAYDEGTKVMVLVPEGIQVECIIVGVDYTHNRNDVVYKLINVLGGSIFYATSHYILERLGYQ